MSNGTNAQQTPSVPGATPPTFGQPNEALQNLIKIITTAAQRPTLAQPVPAPLPPQGQGVPDYMKPSHTWGPAWSTERAMASLSSTIQNEWAQHKASQQAHAESQWNQLLTLTQDQSPEGQQRLQAWMRGNFKDLKKMAQALNQSWLNPEKTDIWHRQLQVALAKHGQKQGALEGLKNLFGHLIGRATQPQLTPGQQDAAIKEILSRAPVTTQQDPKTVVEMMRMLGEREFQKGELDIRSKQLDAERQLHIDNLQMERSRLDTQIQEHKDALAEKKIADADRGRIEQETLDLHRESLLLQRQLASAKLNDAPTQKERQTWVNNELKELIKTRDDMYKMWQDAKKSWYRGESEPKGDYIKAARAVQRLNRLAPQIISGKVNTTDAMNQIYPPETSGPGGGTVNPY